MAGAMKLRLAVLLSFSFSLPLAACISLRPFNLLITEESGRSDKRVNQLNERNRMNTVK